MRSSSSGAGRPRSTPSSRRARPTRAEVHHDSDRALPLAALHDERRVLRPVDELVHGLQAELDRHRQVADRVFERLGPDPGGEGVEDLALLPAGLVEAYPALDGLWRPLG